MRNKNTFIERGNIPDRRMENFRGALLEDGKKELPGEALGDRGSDPRRAGGEGFHSLVPSLKCKEPCEAQGPLVKEERKLGDQRRKNEQVVRDV